jgi:hypothetical protein
MTACHQKVEANKKEEPELRRLLQCYDCPTDNHQCWKVTNEDGVEEHYWLANDVLSDWAFEIVRLASILLWPPTDTSILLEHQLW